MTGEPAELRNFLEKAKFDLAIYIVPAVYFLLIFKGIALVNSEIPVRPANSNILN